MSSEAVLVLSGGQDSTTCLWWAIEEFDVVHCVTIDYGQRHSREIEAAKMVATLAGATSHEIITVPKILVGSSPLVNKTSELEQYLGWDVLPGGLEKTFVPCRNLFFLTIAANRAVAKGITNLVTGVCQEDFGGYPDCRRIFIDAVETALTTGLDTEFHIHTPLMDLTKAKTVEMALCYEGCYQALAYTHTSYDGAYPPTGHDHATLLRAKGFYEAGVPDPLVVRAWKEGLMQLPRDTNYTSQRAVDKIKELTGNVFAP